MPITLTTNSKGVFKKTITLADGDVLHVVKNSTEDADYQLTNNTGENLQVEITVNATTLS